MRTTSGKSRSPRRPARPIEIWAGRQYIATRNASSMRQALLEFSRDRYGKCGVVVGNVLTIDQNTSFTARERKP